MASARTAVHLGRVINRLRSSDASNVMRMFCQHRKFHLQSILQGTTKIDMPSLSPTMTEGTILKWYKQEGDVVAPGDALCDIQTDKAVVTMDTDEDGIIAKILLPDNSKDIKVGTLIALMVDEGDDWRNVEVPATSPPPAEESQPESTPSAKPAAMPAPGAGAHTGPLGPSVRKLLEEYNISTSAVLGSGPHAMITKGDVLNYIKQNNLSRQTPTVVESKKPSLAPETVVQTPPPPPAAPLEDVEFTDIQLSGMRKVIAKRLTESKTTIPHSYIAIDCDMEAVTKLRQTMLADNIKVSMNDFIIKASAIALQRVPKVNCVWQGDTPQLTSAVDISVAVATDQGLITPIVKNAAFLPVDEISSTVKELAGRARQGKLQLNEFQGGSFTISNLGMFGISEFTAVINPPQIAIMAVGGSRLVVGSSGKPQTNLTVNLSYDSRVIDETEAAQFLEVFREVMENPSFMTVGMPKAAVSDFM